MKFIITLVLTVVMSLAAIGQQVGETYVSVPMDSSSSRTWLWFINDSTLEVMTERKEMNTAFTKHFRYNKSDSVIEVFTSSLSAQEEAAPGERTGHFSAPVVKLAKIEGGFIDYSRSLIYVLASKRNQLLTFIIDGKKYLQDVGDPDCFGNFRRKPKRNRALQRQLDKLNKENATMEMVTGLDAYQRFGVTSFFGVAVITTKKPVE
jgi:hypothetical protein